MNHGNCRCTFALALIRNTRYRSNDKIPLLSRSSKVSESRQIYSPVKKKKKKKKKKKGKKCVINPRLFPSRKRKRKKRKNCRSAFDSRGHLKNTSIRQTSFSLPNRILLCSYCKTHPSEALGFPLLPFYPYFFLPIEVIQISPIRWRCIEEKSSCEILHQGRLESAIAAATPATLAAVMLHLHWLKLLASCSQTTNAVHVSTLQLAQQNSLIICGQFIVDFARNVETWKDKVSRGLCCK